MNHHDRDANNPSYVWLMGCTGGRNRASLNADSMSRVLPWKIDKYIRSTTTSDERQQPKVQESFRVTAYHGLKTSVFFSQ